MNYKCLIVDDELSIAQTTCEYLNMFEIPAAYVTSYRDCLEFFEHHTAALLLLDINLGKESGFALCKELRKTLNIPILFLSARTSDDDILTALGLGGDDYITKPYSLSILLAKVKAVLRRCDAASPSDCTDELRFSSVRVDKRSRKVFVKEELVHLKELEFKLLCYLLEHKNQAVTKEELFQNVWNDVFTGDGTLSVHVRRLREKLEDNPNQPQYIKTVWGIGYILEDMP